MTHDPQRTQSSWKTGNLKVFVWDKITNPSLSFIEEFISSSFQFLFAYRIKFFITFSRNCDETAPSAARTSLFYTKNEFSTSRWADESF